MESSPLQTSEKSKEKERKTEISFHLKCLTPKLFTFYLWQDIVCSYWITLLIARCWLRKYAFRVLINNDSFTIINAKTSPSLLVHSSILRSRWVRHNPIIKHFCIFEKNAPFVKKHIKHWFNGDLMLYLFASELEKCLPKVLYQLGLSD